MNTLKLSEMWLTRLYRTGMPPRSPQLFTGENPSIEIISSIVPFYHALTTNIVTISNLAWHWTNLKKFNTSFHNKIYDLKTKEEQIQGGVAYINTKSSQLYGWPLTRLHLEIACIHQPFDWMIFRNRNKLNESFISHQQWLIKNL